MPWLAIYTVWYLHDYTNESSLSAHKERSLDSGTIPQESPQINKMSHGTLITFITLHRLHKTVGVNPGRNPGTLPGIYTLSDLIGTYYQLIQHKPARVLQNSCNRA